MIKYYNIIRDYYGDRKAERSGVPYINHINEGIGILKYLNAPEIAISAYCLHPIFQDDKEIQDNLLRYMYQIDKLVVFYVMEYRNVANRGLSCYQVDDPARIYLGPIEEVHQMLIADKVQNRKDFLKYHFGTHPKSIELDIYFKNWLRALNITEATYQKLAEEGVRYAENY